MTVQSTPSTELARLQRLEDHAALKTLVDTFAILADKKDVASQLLLFTEDATVESIFNGESTGTLIGRQQIGDAFSAFLARFSIVYHQNGQQVVTVDGDRATGTAYSLVILVRDDSGKFVRQLMAVRYDDTYVRSAGVWRISKRVSNFVWQELWP